MKFLEAWEKAEEGDILHNLNTGRKITKTNTLYNCATVSIFELFNHKWSIIKKKKTIFVCLFKDVDYYYTCHFENKKEIGDFIMKRENSIVLKRWEYEI